MKIHVVVCGSFYVISICSRITFLSGSSLLRKLHPQNIRRMPVIIITSRIELEKPTVEQKLFLILFF